MHSPDNRSLRSPDYAASTDTRFRDFPNRRSVSRRINLQTPLLLFLLIATLGRRSLSALFFSVLFALLNDFRLSWSSGSIRSNSFRSRNLFFFHGGHVNDGLVLIGNELDLVVMRQIRNADHFVERQLSDINFNRSRNVCRQALEFDFTQKLLEDAAFVLHAGSFALQRDRHLDGQLLVHGDAL